MATRKRRLKRKKKKTGILLKFALGVFALIIIGVFLYFVFNNTLDKKQSLEKTIKKAYIKTTRKKPDLKKTFDEKANLVFKLTIPSRKVPYFLKQLKKECPSHYNFQQIRTKRQVLIKIDSGKEIFKLLLTIKRKKVKTGLMYEEPIPKESHKTKPKKKKIKVKGQPLLAIIIDDCGIGHMESFEKALKIPYPITFAILPFRTFSKKCAFLANGKGYKIILHMPMEPISYPKSDPGPGAIFKTDRKTKILEKLENAFSNIVFAEGFNNHMGSAVTQSRFAVRVLLSYAKKHNKFFIDSRTTPYTVVEEEANKLGITVFSRDVFLDNIVDYKHIKKQLNEAINKAYQHGYAIAIGHNYPTTIDVLSKEMPKLDKKVNFIFVRDLYNEIHR